MAAASGGFLLRVCRCMIHLFSDPTHQIASLSRYYIISIFGYTIYGKKIIIFTLNPKENNNNNKNCKNLSK